MKTITVYVTESGKRFDTSDEANRCEAPELLDQQLHLIADSDGLNDDQRNGFVQSVRGHCDELLVLLNAYKNRIDDDLPF